jgi:glycosyltransferase involved in cell wall biosynthesis
MKLSIITATHRRPDKLRARCLSSIASQTRSDFEWVVINDGSDPETRQVVETAPRDLDVRYIEMPHRGLVASRNLGLDEAKGDLISFLDDDNILHAAFVETMSRHFDAHPEMMMSVPVRRQRRDVYRNGECVRKGKEFLRPSPGATNEDFVKSNRNAWFDSNGFVHRRADAIRFNPNLLVLSDYEYLLQCFSLWGLEALLVYPEELVHYVQTNEGIIGQSTFEDEWREREFIWENRAKYGIFTAVAPEPWLRDQIEEAKARALSGESLPGFPKEMFEND